MLIFADHRGRPLPASHPVRPSLETLLRRFITALWKWARAGFPRLSQAESLQRKGLCQECSYWRPQGFWGLGQCAACGCSGLKQWLPTETCPKWRPVLPQVRVVSRLAKPSEVAGLILAYYARRQPVRRKPLPPLQGFGLFQRQNGLGDTLILTDLVHTSQAAGRPVPVFSDSPHFPVLHPDRMPARGHLPRIEVFDLYWNHDCGAGHLMQRLRRAFGLPVDPLPRAFIRPDLLPESSSPGPIRVILHFEAGQHAQWQRRHLHPRARQLYPENAALLERFMAGHPAWEFCQVGRSGPVLRGARSCLGYSLPETIRLMAGAKWFIGIISGPMHLATALGLKCIVLINFPNPKQIYLPNLVSTTQVEEEWFYPQNVHLHQDGPGPLVPRFSRHALEAALAGEVYPFWRNDWLNL